MQIIQRKAPVLVHKTPLNTLKTRGNTVENSREGGRTVGSGVVKSIIE